MTDDGRNLPVGGAYAQPRRVLAARAAVYLAVAYVALTTSDIDIGRVPLKVFVVALALAGWLATSRPWRQSRKSYVFAGPALLGGVLIPSVWFVIALLLHHRHDPAQVANSSYEIQQASRFFYLLLYFPIVEEIRRCAATQGPGDDRLLRIHRVWLWPTLVLCGITVLLFLGHALLGFDYGGNVGPLQGEIAVESTGTFRDYLIDDVMLIPAIALLLGNARSGHFGNLGIGVTFALLSTAYLSHTRGIWLGAMVAAVVILLLSGVRIPPSRPAGVIAVLLTCVFLGAFVINADPSVSSKVVSLVSQRNELSTSDRLEQAPQLLHGFRRHVAFGSGLGATLPSGYKRNSAEPWSFELSYLQLLFQLGVVGIALLLTIPVLTLYRGARSLIRSDPDHRAAIAAAVAGTVGFLFTSGGNPYLMTSVGMLALAVVLAMTEQATASNFDLLPQVAQSGLTSLTLWDLPLFRRLDRFRSWRPGAVFWIIVLVGVAGVAEFARTRRAVLPTAVGSATAVKPTPVDEAQRRVLRLPSGFLAEDSAQLVANNEQPDGFDVWNLTTLKGALLASRWRLQSGRISPGPPRSVGPAPAGEDSHLTVVRFNATHPDTLGVTTTIKSHIHVELRDLDHGGRDVLVGSTPALPLSPGVSRDVGLGPYNGASADLIVVDRSAAASVLNVRIFSSVSHFHSEILDIVINKGPFPASKFSLVIGPVNSPVADLMLITRNLRTTSGHTEVHVLVGPQVFQAFGEQSPVNLPERLSPGTKFLLGREGGVAVLYVVNRATGALDIVQLL